MLILLEIDTNGEYISMIYYFKSGFIQVFFSFVFTDNAVSELYEWCVTFQDFLYLKFNGARGKP